MKNIVVIGGGAAGLMAAGTAAKSGARVTVLEKMPRPARKLLITGKGRCNVTNKTDVNGLMSAVMSNPKFLFSAFNRFDCDDTISFFEALGVPLKVERGNRVFPVSDKAVHIVDALVSYAKSNGAEIVNDIAQEIMMKDSAVCGVKAEGGRVYNANAVILATGGKSYPLTGSTGDGYLMASDLGHTVIKPQASLVGLNIKENCCNALAGLSLKNVKLKLFDTKGKLLYSEQGEMLFTHTGISGPLVLSASAFVRNESTEYKVIIDLKPALDEKKLDERILRDFAKFTNKNFSNALFELLPKSIIPVIIEKSGISGDRVVNGINKEERKNLVNVIKNFEMTVVGKRPIEEAVITSGGISVKEISPNTMESKLIDGLYFAGEIIDVDAVTGGFNLQIAFSTGHLAGLSCI